MSARVEIYSTLLCPFCYRAKKLLESKGVAFEEIDVMLSPSRRREMIERSGGRTSVPQIFVNGVHIGNCDEIHALDAAGRLDALLAGDGLE
ncbi:MAG: glutaredoxin 3 [Alphaproteobacteria bacterium]|nr:MAG: glutaredoxin 3 [Alphaproteobacteria bacterium]